MGDFYVTLLSDASQKYYPNNTISNFRNKLADPIRLNSRKYEVALVDCVYVHSEIVIEKGELLHTYKGKNYHAANDIVSVNELVTWINDPSKPWFKDFYISNGAVVARTSDKGVYLADWTPRIRAMLGYDEQEKAYIHKKYSHAGTSLIFVYCNIVQPQRVGDSFVPLLRRMTNHGAHGEITTREFEHLQYLDVVYDAFDEIHVYIKTEDGHPPSFVVGPFSITLHFRQKMY